MSLAKPLFILAMCHIFQEGWLVLRHCGACGASSCPPCRRRAQRSLPANLDFQCKHFRFLSASPFAWEDIPWMPRPSDFPLLHGFALRRVSNFSQLRAGGTIKISVFQIPFSKVGVNECDLPRGRTFCRYCGAESDSRFEKKSHPCVNQCREVLYQISTAL